MATIPGTGTPGANQNGPVPAPVYSPGEVVTAAGPASINAPAPQIDLAVGSNLVTKAYELAAWGALRPEIIFDQFATVRSTRSSHNGSSVQFTFLDDLPEAVTPLLENVDVDSTALDSTTVEVTMREYGVAVTRTALLRGTSMIPFDPIAAERVGWNAGVSQDTLARTALDQATNSITGATLSSEMLREGVRQMKVDNVRPFAGGSYVAVISPSQEKELKAEADAAGWRFVVGNGEGGGNSIYRGEVGLYEGVRIVVNNHLTDQDTGYLMGQEALAKAFSSVPGFGPMPRVVVSPVVDKLRRFASVGWYWLGGYKIFRQEAIRLIDTSS